MTDVLVPGSHLDLLVRPIAGVFTTMLPDGQPHCSLVRVDHDGSCARVKTILERRAGGDVFADDRVSLLVVDPDDSTRFLQIRGVAELVAEDSEEPLDEVDQRHRERQVICRIHARRVTLDAIHR
jgi:hypothetical protein